MPEQILCVEKQIYLSKFLPCKWLVGADIRKRILLGWDSPRLGNLPR